MVDLTVHGLDEELVQRLQAEAIREGISAEEAHRRVLCRALTEKPVEQSPTFNEFLLTMPDFDDAYELYFERQPESLRIVDLSD